MERKYWKSMLLDFHLNVSFEFDFTGHHLLKVDPRRAIDGSAELLCCLPTRLIFIGSSA